MEEFYKLDAEVRELYDQVSYEDLDEEGREKIFDILVRTKELLEELL